MPRNTSVPVPDRYSTRWYDVPRAAEYLGTSERFIRRLVLERRIPFHKLGGRLVRFDVEDLATFIAAGRVEADS